MRSDSSARAVTMMIGIAAVASLDRISRQTSRPSTCGSIRSSSDQIRRLRGDHLQRFAARRGALGQEACLVEIPRDELGNVRIVLDDQDA